MRLIRRHPGYTERDCGHCQQFQYDENTGKVVERDGAPLPRYGPLLCKTGKCPKGTPEAPKSLNERNWQAYRHYLRCRAVGRFPDDPIVERNAMLIRSVEDSIDREDRKDFERLLIEAVAKH